MIIELHRARSDEAPTLRHLMELCQYDISEFTGEDVGEDGLYGYAWLDHTWIEPGRHAFVVRVGGRVAGFVLVRELERSGQSAEPLHEIAEMFILRKFRRRGVGRAVARRVFDMFPGRWRVQEAEPNTVAQVFWRSVIAEYTRGHFEEAHEKGSEFRGVVQRFHSRPPQ